MYVKGCGPFGGAGGEEKADMEEKYPSNRPPRTQMGRKLATYTSQLSILPWDRLQGARDSLRVAATRDSRLARSLHRRRHSIVAREARRRVHPPSRYATATLGKPERRTTMIGSPKGKKARSWSAQKVGPLEAAYGSPTVSGKKAAATYLEAAAAALGT